MDYQTKTKVNLQQRDYPLHEGISKMDSKAVFQVSANLHFHATTNKASLASSYCTSRIWRYNHRHEKDNIFMLLVDYVLWEID